MAFLAFGDNLQPTTPGSQKCEGVKSQDKRSLEACLPKMVVRGQRQGNPAPPHDLERNAVGERPRLVAARPEQDDRILQQCRLQRYHGDLRIVRGPLPGSSGDTIPNY